MSALGRPGGTPQLDLFVDGRETVLLHGLGEALAAGHPDAAREALEQLRRHEPAHPDLAALGRCCEAVRPDPPAPDSSSALAALARELETMLRPAAERLLGPEAPAALGPTWRRLVDGAAGVRLDELEGGGRLRFWVGAAHHHLGRRRHALRLWLSLAWLDPRTLATLGPRCPEDSLRLAWITFERRPGFEIPDDSDAAVRWFPAWVFLHDREFAGVLAADEIRGADPAAVAARQVLALLPLETRGLSDEVVQGRRALRETAPTFFQYYLRRVGR